MTSTNWASSLSKWSDRKATYSNPGPAGSRPAERVEKIKKKIEKISRNRVKFVVRLRFSTFKFFFAIPRPIIPPPLTCNPADFAQTKSGAASAGNVRTETVAQHVYVGRVDHREIDEIFQQFGDNGTHFRGQVRRHRIHDVASHRVPVHRDDVVTSGGNVSWNPRSRSSVLKDTTFSLFQKITRFNGEHSFVVFVRPEPSVRNDL